MVRVLFLACGAAFGFLLHQARATDYDAIINMFTFRDFHLMGVMGSAIATAAVGLFVLRKSGAKSVAGGGAIEVHPKPMQPWIFVAGLVFGAGWALTGT